MQIPRARILAQLGAGETLQVVAATFRIHPFIVGHIQRENRKQARKRRSRETRRSSRRKLNADTLRAALASGKTVRQIAKETGVLFQSVYKACDRWGIPIPSSQVPSGK